MIVDRLPPLCETDIVHVHASPPCQALSSANPNRPSLEYTFSLIRYVLRLVDILPCTSFSMEEVNSKHLRDFLDDTSFSYFIMQMNKYGVCQTRTRIIVYRGWCPSSLKESPHPTLHNTLQIPSYCTHIAHHRKLETGLKRLKKQARRRIEMGSLFFTITSKSFYFTDQAQKSQPITLTDRERLQTFEPGYISNLQRRFFLSVMDVQTMIANAVPPLIAKNIIGYGLSEKPCKIGVQPPASPMLCDVAPLADVVAP